MDLMKTQKYVKKGNPLVGLPFPIVAFDVKTLFRRFAGGVHDFKGGAAAQLLFHI